MKKSIINCSIDDASIDEIVKKIEQNIENRVKTFHISLNTDSVVRANYDDSYAKQVRKADIATIDGMPLIFLSKILGNEIHHRVTGPDIFIKVLEIANRKKLKVYFLGSTEAIIKVVIDRVRQNYPNVQISGAQNGYFDKSKKSKIVSNIAKSRSDILFLALGAPKQDEFIADNFDKLNVVYATGVGGCFDIFAGIKKRAPIFLQNIALEWLFRFIQEPKRLFKRYFIYDIKIFPLLFKELYKKYFGKGHKRSQTIKKNIALTLALQTLSLLLGFLTVPIALSYVGSDSYGIFLTIGSFMTWFALLDFGFGQGLRSKLSEALSQNEISLAKSYISTAYFALIIIFSLIYIAFSIINHYINWATIIGVSQHYSQDIRHLMYFVFAGFCLQLVLNLLNTISTADQKPSYVSLFSFVSAFVTLLVLASLSYTTHGSLLRYGLAIIFCPILTYLFFSLFMFSKKYRTITPSITSVKIKYLKQLFDIGIKFFVIQLSMIIIFQTDYLIISRLFGPTEVVAYNIVYKYFAVSSTVFAMIVAPFWSATTEAYIKKDFLWIQNAVKKLKKVYRIFFFIALVMLIISPWFYHLWLKDAVIIPIRLSISMFVYSQLLNWGSIYVVFINGVGKIKTQLIIGIIAAVINIPLSIIFSKTLGIGASGVIIATTICIFYGYGIAPFQLKKLLEEKL